MANYTGTTFQEMNLPGQLQVGDILRLNYSGAMQPLYLSRFSNFFLIRLKIECWGASALAGSFGGYSKGEKTLNINDVLYCYCGGAGQRLEGGFNGGGRGFTTDMGYSGGGATDVRLNIDDLYNRIIVAGGATMGAKGVAGHGGGLEGQGADNTGGTQTAGGVNPYGNNGSFGQGGDCKPIGAGRNGCGGGAGWYGGAGAQQTNNSNISEASAGGGSGYIGGVENGESHHGGTNYGNREADKHGYMIFTVLDVSKSSSVEQISKVFNTPNYDGGV